MLQFGLTTTAIGIPYSPHKTYYAVQKVINHYKREHNTPSTPETNQSIFLRYALKVFSAEGAGSFNTIV